MRVGRGSASVARRRKETQKIIRNNLRSAYNREGVRETRKAS